MNFKGARPQKLSRIQLENMIAGDFRTIAGTSIRTNGNVSLVKRKTKEGEEFIATIKKPEGGYVRFVARSWFLLAKKLKVMKE